VHSGLSFWLGSSLDGSKKEGGDSYVFCCCFCQRLCLFDLWKVLLAAVVIACFEAQVMMRTAVESLRTGSKWLPRWSDSSCERGYQLLRSSSLVLFEGAVSRTAEVKSAFNNCRVKVRSNYASSFVHSHHHSCNYLEIFLAAEVLSETSVLEISTERGLEESGDATLATRIPQQYAAIPPITQTSFQVARPGGCHAREFFMAVNDIYSFFFLSSVMV